MYNHINRQTGSVYLTKSFQEAIFLVDTNIYRTAITGDPGTGKTTLGVIKVLNKLYTGCNGAMIANNFPNARHVLFEELRKWIDPEQVDKKQRSALEDPNWRPNGSVTFKFANGAKLFLAHEADSDSIQSLPNLNFVFMDEPKADLLVREMLARCQFKYLGLQEITPQFWITCRNKDHLYFVDLEDKGFDTVNL